MSIGSKKNRKYKIKKAGYLALTHFKMQTTENLQSMCALVDDFYRAIDRVASKSGNDADIFARFFHILEGQLKVVHESIFMQNEKYYNVFEIYRLRSLINNVYPYYEDSTDPEQCFTIDQLTINNEITSKMHARRDIIKNHHGHDSAAEITQLNRMIISELQDIQQNIFSMLRSVVIKSRQDHVYREGVMSAIRPIVCDYENLTPIDIEIIESHAGRLFKDIVSSKIVKSKLSEKGALYFRMMLRAPNVEQVFREQCYNALAACKNMDESALTLTVDYFTNYSVNSDINRFRHLYICEISSQIQILCTEILKSDLCDQQKNSVRVMFEDVIKTISQVSSTLSTSNQFDEFQILSCLAQLEDYANNEKSPRVVCSVMQTVINLIKQLTLHDFNFTHLNLNNALKDLRRQQSQLATYFILTQKRKPNLSEVKNITTNLLMLALKYHIDNSVENYKSIIYSMSSYNNLSAAEKKQLTENLISNEQYLFEMQCKNTPYATRENKTNSERTVNLPKPLLV